MKPVPHAQWYNWYANGLLMRHVDQLAGGLSGDLVIDVGCGDQPYRPCLAGFKRYVGFDSVDAPDRGDHADVLGDALALPFADGCADAILCRQVLEHAERPRELVADAARVLRPGGLIGGSTSQLEPYHSRSTANPTPYGLVRLLAAAGLQALELRPGVDGATLIARRLAGAPRSFDRFFTGTSPLNALLEVAGRALGADAGARNSAKLALCGHFCFLARRPA